MSRILTVTIERLNDAIACAKSEKASFGSPFGWKPVTLHTPEEADAYVKQAIRLHHETWIVPPMENAVKMLRLYEDALHAIERIAQADSQNALDALREAIFRG